MTFIDWFSGIGGFRCGLERAGLGPCVAHSEIDDYAEKVYQKHWPDSLNLGDITKVNAADIPEAELWCGGFPCQPFSVAGKRKGAADARNLWPVWMDLIRLRRPRILFGENVPGLLADPQFGTILSDLSTAGYRVEWTVIGAYEVGAPHKRDRLWIVAHTDELAAHREARRGRGCVHRPERPAPSWSGWRAQRFDGGEQIVEIPFPDRMPAEFSGIDDGVPNRVDRLRCLGNAVVPQVVEWIGRRILAAG